MGDMQPMHLRSTRLSTIELHALVAIRRGQCHAPTIGDESSRRYGRRVTAPMVYDALRRLRTMGLVVECQEPEEASGDPGRIRRYRVTPRGHVVARAEIEHLTVLLNDCQATGF